MPFMDTYFIFNFYSPQLLQMDIFPQFKLVLLPVIISRLMHNYDGLLQMLPCCSFAFGVLSSYCV